MDWLEQHNHLFTGPSNDLLTEIVHGRTDG